MNNLSVKRTPEVIAIEINSIKDQTRSILLNNSIEIGRRLVEAKQLVPYGEWGNWLKESVEYSQSTANNLMKIFNEYSSDQISLLGDNVKSQALGNLTYTQAVALLGIPEEEREAFVQEHDIDNMSTRELQQAIKERDQAKATLEDVRSILKDKSEENVKYYAEKNKAEADARLANKVLKEAQETVKVLEESLQKQREEAKDLEEKLVMIMDKNLDPDGKDNEEVNQLQEALSESERNQEQLQKQIEELQQQLKDRPIETTAVIEKIPEEVEKELQELREKAQNGPAAVKFKVHFDSLVKGFNDLLIDLQEMQKDEEAFSKYRTAISSLISKMQGRL